VARRLHEFEGRSTRKTWLFAIAFQIARSYRRDRARQQRLSVALAHHGASGHGSPHHGDPSEVASLLHRLLQQLDDEKRAVFVMAELEEMTAPEMAAVLGLKLPTVYSRLRLARAQMEKAVALHRKQTEESGKRGVP
jgi:RNA polymerase sigma-70 factor (ECF subfamily)